jgi:hypothetical protein
MNKRFLLGGALCFLFLLSPAWAHEAHEHGAAKMDVEIEGQEVKIELETPLANLISFEHAPRTQAQTREIRQMAVALHTKALFSFPSAARCTPKEVSLKSEVISSDLLAPPSASDEALKKTASVAPKKAEKGKHEEEEHADLDADFTYRCQNPQALTYIKTSLFSAFPRFKRVDVQLVGPKGQRAAKLTPRSSVIKW